MKRLVLLVGALVLAVPSAGHAAPTTYTPAYGLGPQGGDGNNTFVVDETTGEMAVIRHQLTGVNGTLGCGGQGGYAYFEVAHEAASALESVTVTYTDAVVDPYTFIRLGLRQDGDFLGSTDIRGPIVSAGQGLSDLDLGDGTITVTLDDPDLPPVTGEVVAWFGIQVSSACPNIDGGSALFDSITFNEA
ncbi:MAG TPA: hypothetical protein VGB83_06370 [Actinomycetota bacterium]